MLLCTIAVYYNFCIIFHYVNISHIFIHLTVNKHLKGLQLQSITNNASIEHNCMSLSTHIYAFLLSMTLWHSWVMGYECIYSALVNNCQIAFQNIWNLSSRQQCMMVLVTPYLHQHIFVSAKMVLYCGFNLHFLMKIKLSTFSLDIFSEVPVTVFSHFSTRLSDFFINFKEYFFFVGYRFWDYFIPFCGLHFLSLEDIFRWIVVLDFDIIFCSFFLKKLFLTQDLLVFLLSDLPTSQNCSD